ncbi:HD domain-containing phosphohydrolase [Bradyrhizobium guangdongense]|uniref:HD domain-containing phosphohydrolase n=1 Tax=Bradyrhizobium guangdongense TaxID=1325090 RepID=UPI001642B3F4|nr:HD domain-containing phosphohydrolase [Bradyrhizobium guangdongense]
MIPSHRSYREETPLIAPTTGARAETDAGIRQAEIVVALSRATELAMGQPVDFALRSCVLGVDLARALGMDAEDVRDVFYLALMRYVGCNAETYALAALFGDEIALRRALAPIDLASPAELGPVLLRLIAQANADAPMPQRLWRIVGSLAQSKAVSTDVLTGHCEVAERFGTRLGFKPRIVRNLGQLYARWDGKGIPHGVKGEAISPAVRIVALVQDALTLDDAYGRDRCLATLRRRRGSAYDPRIVDRFVMDADALLHAVEARASWQAVLALEPEPFGRLAAADIDEMLLALADFVDIKSPFTSGHSRAVAELAAEAARRCNLPESDAIALSRAGLVHDLGQAGVATAILVKPGALSEAEWEKVRLHPYHAERILDGLPLFAPLARLVGSHHERGDGSGYHRGLRGDAVPLAAKILAVAEAYQSMIEPRSYRAAMSPAAAAQALQQAVRAGKMDGDAVRSVLAAAGHAVTRARFSQIAGLTPREIEVLRLLAGGQSIKEIARSLGVAPKTADNHLQNLYAKIGVKTRGGATLFALEHGLGAAPGHEK